MKSLAIGIILLFVGTITFPAIANNTVNLEDEKQPGCIGKIYGRVGNSHGIYTWVNYIFAKVDADVAQTRTGLLGRYRLFLPLNREYNITAYKSGFKPITKVIYLSEGMPTREVNFDFFETEIGYIYGEVGNSHGMFTWSPYPFALVTTENKRVRCGLLGQYSMKLSLHHEYNVTAHVLGFKPLTKHVYLTEEEPKRRISFDMY